MQYRLTNGNVALSMLRFSLPYLLSYFLQTLYGLADLFIAGQFNGAEVLSAVAIGSQIMHMLTVVVVGLSMGTTVLVSRAVGADDPKSIPPIAGTTVRLFMGFSLVCTVLLLVCTDGIVALMSTPEEAAAETRRYLFVCFAGIPFIVAYNVLSALLRGLGDSKTPLMFVAAACAVNIALDFVLMGPLHLGAVGAALGTVLSQMASVLLALAVLPKLHAGIPLSKKDFSRNPPIANSILRIGLPIAAQDGFIQVSFLVITVIANQRGLTVAAAVGIVEKVIGFLFLVPSSLLSAVSVVAAQNIGARQPRRAKEALLAGVLMAASVGAVAALAFQWVASPVLKMFTSDKAVAELGVQYIRTYVLDCCIAGIHFAFSGFFSAYGLSLVSFVHNALSIILVRVPGAWLSSRLFPDTLYCMGLAAPAGSLLSVCICTGVYMVLESRHALDRAA